LLIFDHLSLAFVRSPIENIWHISELRIIIAPPAKLLTQLLDYFLLLSAEICDNQVNLSLCGKGTRQCGLNMPLAVADQTANRLELWVLNVALPLKVEMQVPQIELALRKMTVAGVVSLFNDTNKFISW